jgi:hypothetical protein
MFNHGNIKRNKISVNEHQGSDYLERAHFTMLNGGYLQWCNEQWLQQRLFFCNAEIGRGGDVVGKPKER